MIRQYLLPSFLAVFFFTIVTGIIYPAIATALIHGGFAKKAEGSLIKGKDGKVLGSELIGQNFTQPKYFWGRLSATGPYPYNAVASSGSNLGPRNPALLDNVKGRIAELNKYPHPNKPIPVDLVTSSGSGLDLQISIEAVEYQIPRVSKERGINENEVRKLVAKYTEPRQFAVLGEAGVNVLKLNLALDGKIDR